MEPETVRWISGLVAGVAVYSSAFLWALRTLNIRAKHTEAKLDVLIKMHRQPDKYGFGSKELLEKTEDAHKEQIRASRELIHYIKWLVEKLAGEPPEPFIDRARK